MTSPEVRAPKDSRARVAIDLGAESCRVSLLRWPDNQPQITQIHRIANGPVQRGDSHHWPLSEILAGLEEGLRKAADSAPEGIASLAVDGWAVDYVRLDEHGTPLQNPFCYRDERTLASKARADSIIAPDEAFRLTGAQPLRINTLYQLLADDTSVANHPWVCLPEYILHWLGAPRVAEYTNATHTGLVDVHTGQWASHVFEALNIPLQAAPPIVSPGTKLGRLDGPLAKLPAFRNTELIAPACHDTASAIAGIPADLASTAYICSGTWSLVGTLIPHAVTTSEAQAARYTNQGAATGGFCFHSNVNGMWLLRQCMETWAATGHPTTVEDLVKRSAQHSQPVGTINVDSDPLLLAGDMPRRINDELRRAGHQPIPDIAGNEPAFARVIFESLAQRYAAALNDLEKMLDRRLARIHIIGGASRNQLLADLTSHRTDIPVTCGHPESSTIGNFAVQLASTETEDQPLSHEQVRHWASRLCTAQQPCN
jgi:rhamnulokinase